MLTVIADNLPRLMECNGSRLMSPAFPAIDTDTTARDEGTAADWMAQKIFDGVPVADLIGKPASNGFIMTGEMGDFVSQYVAALDCGEMQVDTSYTAENWHVGGRADHIGLRDGVLTIDDLKYGYSIVEPENNWTLIWHAIGYCLTRQIKPDTIVLSIHQPRAYHADGQHRSWSIGYDELIRLYWRVNETLSNPSDELRTGIGWCRRCYALASCPAAARARMNAVDATALAFNDQIPDDALSYELDLIRTAKATLEAQMNALEELASHRLRNGAVIDNYAIVPQYANTRWKSWVDPKVLSVASGIDCIKPGIVTPAEFKRRGGSEAVASSLTERPLVGSKLIRATADQRARRGGLGGGR